MALEMDKEIIVIGHKNPGTDSICSAIAYAAFKRTTTGGKYEAFRAGKMSQEARFVLEYFGVKEPPLIEDVRTQVSDIEIRRTKGVPETISLKKAWNIMQEDNVNTIPAVRADGMLEGLITVSDITTTYMNIYDSSILSKAHTSYANIIETLEGSLVIGDGGGYFEQGKVLIAAANPDMMEYYIEPHDLVIMGNRYESQLCAIEMEADCIVVTQGALVSDKIKKLAAERGCTVISTPYDTYMAARLINQSMPISYFLTRDKLITFSTEDYIDDIREVMASRRTRDFPILDKDGRYLGMISRRNLLGAKGKPVILVDHNEKSRAVNGIESAQLLEIIDHHRLGTIQTIAPVYFRNQPVGCTATIIAQMYGENGLEPDKTVAGLLCSAIISDTMLFSSPTCTPADVLAARKLADIAELDIDAYAMEMFGARGGLRDKTEEEIFNQDFKCFTAGKLHFGVGRVTSLNGAELDELSGRMRTYLADAPEKTGLDMVFFMFTDILKQSTKLLCIGEGACSLAAKAFCLDTEMPAQEGILSLEGIVSRRKQLLPSLLAAQMD